MAKFNDFLIKFKTYILTNGKVQKFSSKALKFPKPDIFDKFGGDMTPTAPSHGAPGIHACFVDMDIVRFLQILTGWL